MLGRGSLTRTNENGTNEVFSRINVRSVSRILQGKCQICANWILLGKEKGRKRGTSEERMKVKMSIFYNHDATKILHSIQVTFGCATLQGHSIELNLTNLKAGHRFASHWSGLAPTQKNTWKKLRGPAVPRSTEGKCIRGFLHSFCHV